MAKSITIYHNPRCSKSRETLALIEEHGYAPRIVEYLKTPPTATELKNIVSKLDIPAKNLIRTKEDLFRSFNDIDLDNDSAVIRLLVENPVLLERPIVIAGTKAALGRPPSNVLAIL